MATEGVNKHSVHTLVFRSLKRTHEMFLADQGVLPAEDPTSARIKMACKVRDEYSLVKDMQSATPSEQISSTAVAGSSSRQDGRGVEIRGTHAYPSMPGVSLSADNARRASPSVAGMQQVMEALPPSRREIEAEKMSHGIRDIHRKAAASGGRERIAPQSKALIQVEGTRHAGALMPRQAPSMPKPQWHPPWKLMRVLSGHVGWVRSIALDPTNEWFATGSADRTIKIWDLASGTLKLSLTGHISTVRGLAVSERQPYLFSGGEDKQVKCWDLEQNKVVRHYHGHLSAVHALCLHPTIDILISCGRDSTARVWDIRTKACIHTLVGHTNTVASVKSQGVDPQVVTGSHDSTIRLWDLAAGKSRCTLTNHKKSVRSLAIHPTQFSFASGSADNIKQWKFPDGNFIQNLSGHNAIINCLGLNSDNVLVSGADNGTIHLWDWKTGYNFQRIQSQVQPGSLDSEAGIFACEFDMSGSRLITAESDKTVKIYKEDELATEESHPINWKPDILKRKKY
ncbi:pleiotropic regulator 1-like [Corticium candelabrum]|uniref:pleiotropic regulator 1-like n=1 Tax=Corticium candelabrum TaxID=121492 RepID=UPI002E274495|nr:pleiotropic regulator 1-like [Corticium candelabrum]